MGFPALCILWFPFSRPVWHVLGKRYCQSSEDIVPCLYILWLAYEAWSLSVLLSPHLFVYTSCCLSTLHSVSQCNSPCLIPQLLTPCLPVGLLSYHLTKALSMRSPPPLWYSTLHLLSNNPTGRQRVRSCGIRQWGLHWETECRDERQQGI